MSGKFGKYEKDGDIAYACGAFACMELLSRRPEAIRALLIRPESLRNEGARKLIEACRSRGLYVQEAPNAIERIAGKENCYAVAAFQKYESTLDPGACHIVLHQISDMGNFGTIARTALGFGYQNIALIRPCVDVFHPRAVRAAMGAVFGLNTEYFESFDAYRARFPAHAHYYFRLRNAVPIGQIAPEKPYSLVFGNEAAGLPPELELLQTGVFIPHGTQIDSLNLSVAAGIGMACFAGALNQKEDADE